ncbi:secondary carrier transporter [Lithospermum erythrorhizon]|uniref:Secondary carrier transporter n=1 Tax=Lithospermum erythrorhizon TaxID=34254 RepID=A0AAV3QEW3_LITER
MKFGKEFASQMVPEWQEAYMDYNHLKKLLKEILGIIDRKASALPSQEKANLNRRLTLYRAFSGLNRRSSSVVVDEEAEILINAERSSDFASALEQYQSTLINPSEEGADEELAFFKSLDHEFQKALNFYKTKVEDAKEEADGLSRQMDAIIALRVAVDCPLGGDSSTSGMETIDILSSVSSSTNKGRLASIGENEGFNGSKKDASILEGGRHRKPPRQSNGGGTKYKPPSLDVLDHVKINCDSQTPLETLKHVLMTSEPEAFSKVELKKAEEIMKQAFIEFHKELRLLKNFSFLNQLALSKILKKYDKITSRNASKFYLQISDRSYHGICEEVNKLLAKVETVFVKHFSNGNRREGMKFLRPSRKIERHRITFFLGLFTGCTIALVAAVVIAVHARDILNSEGRNQYMDNIYPLYSLFLYVVLHMIMLSGDIFFWRRFRVNYAFIFNMKTGTELGYRELLLVASGLSVLALAATLSNLDMDMNPDTRSFAAITELVPLVLLIMVFLITFCPFDVVYRPSRFLILNCGWRCLCAPLYKVTLPDFFFADQLTSQVQAMRSLVYYACYYGWGDYKMRTHKCLDSDVYEVVYIAIAIIPYWSRFLQSFRRYYEEKDSMQAINGLKYMSTIVALVMRTSYDMYKGWNLKVLAALTSTIATVYNTYWDLVIDWGLLRRDSKNAWLRDKLVIPQHRVYFVAMVVNVILRFVWMQVVLDINEAPFVHKKAFVSLVASLEIVRRGIWNFFRDLQKTAVPDLIIPAERGGENQTTLHDDAYN